MKFGACVAASRRSSLPELVTDARALFDPDDPGDIARVVGTLLADAGLRREIEVRRRHLGFDGAPMRYLILTIPPPPGEPREAQ